MRSTSKGRDMRSHEKPLYFKCDACAGVGKIAGDYCRDCGGVGYRWTEEGQRLIQEDHARLMERLRS
jgi:DnaJ-class molecular chaperone